MWIVTFLVSFILLFTLSPVIFQSKEERQKEKEKQEENK